MRGTPSCSRGARNRSGRCQFWSQMSSRERISRDSERHRAAAAHEAGGSRTRARIPLREELGVCRGRFFLHFTRQIREMARVRHSSSKHERRTSISAAREGRREATQGGGAQRALSEDVQRRRFVPFRPRRRTQVRWRRREMSPRPRPLSCNESASDPSDFCASGARSDQVPKHSEVISFAAEAQQRCAARKLLCPVPLLSQDE